MGLLPGDAHKATYPISADIAGKLYIPIAVTGVGICFHKFNACGYDHAGVHVHVPSRHGGGDAGEPDCFLIISHNCSIFLYNYQLPQASFLR